MFLHQMWITFEMISTLVNLLVLIIIFLIYFHFNIIFFLYPGQLWIELSWNILWRINLIFNIIVNLIPWNSHACWSVLWNCHEPWALHWYLPYIRLWFIIFIPMTKDFILSERKHLEYFLPKRYKIILFVFFLCVMFLFEFHKFSVCVLFRYFWLMFVFEVS